MSNKPFKNLRKGQPRNFAKLVCEELANEQVIIKPSFVYDVLRGRKKDTPLTLRVLNILFDLKKQQLKLKEKVARVRAKKVSV